MAQKRSLNNYSLIYSFTDSRIFQVEYVPDIVLDAADYTKIIKMQSLHLCNVVKAVYEHLLYTRHCFRHLGYFNE